jgi:hypothetical protein
MQDLAACLGREGEDGAGEVVGEKGASEGCY